MSFLPRRITTWAKTEGPGLAVISIMVTAFYFPSLISGTTCLLPAYQDESQWMLYRAFVERCFAAGRFPLWIPDLYAGLPFLAWSHSGALSPAGLLFAWLGFGRGVLINMWLHQLIIFYGLYYLCRELSASRLGAFFGTITVGTVMLMENLSDFMPFVLTASWVPWIYFFAARLMRRRRLLDFCFLIPVNLIAFSGGDVEMLSLSYELLSLGLILALIFYRDRFREIIRGGLVLALAFLIVIVSALVWVLPTQELLHFSIRSPGITYEYFTIWSSPVQSLSLWPWLLIIPPVIPALVFAAAGAKKEKPLLILLLIVAAAFMIALNLLGTMRLIYQLPVLRGLLAHSRIMAPALFLAAPLLARGWDRLLLSPRSSRAMVYVDCLAVLLALIYIFCFHYLPRGNMGGEPFLGPVMAKRISLIAGFSGVLIALALVHLLVLWRIQGPAFRGMSQAALMAMVLLIGILPAYLSMPRRPVDPFRYPPAYAEFFKDRPGLYRTLNVYPWDRWEHIALPVQSGVLYGTQAIDAYITVSIDWYTRFLNKIVPGVFREKNGKIADLEAAKLFKQGDFISPDTLPLVNLLGLKYIFIEDKNLKLASDYFLAYADHPFARGVEMLVRRDDKWVGLHDLALNDQGLLEAAADLPPHAQARLYINPGDRLLFKLQKKQNARPAGPRKISASRISIPAHDQEPERLIFALSDEEISQDKEYQVDLSEMAEKTIVMDFDLAPDLLLVNPRIHNDRKYFQRLPVSGMNVFENPGAFPRAFIVSRVLSVADPQARLNIMTAQDFDLKTAAVWEEPGPREWPAGQGRVEVDRYESDQVTMRAYSEQGGLLVFTDVYYPGWRVLVDNKQDRIRRVDSTFRGVVLDRGEHRLKFIYQPLSFRIGLWSSMVGIITVTVLCVVWGWGLNSKFIGKNS